MNRLLLKSIAVCALISPLNSFAETYPDRTVRIIVSLAPGATNDIVARAVGQKLSEQFKQPFIVENKTGGNGTIAAAYVAKSPADGYTLMLGNTSTLAIHPSLFTNLVYDPVKDFRPVSILAESPSVLVVNPALPAKTIQEFVAYAKAHPKAIAYGSPGSGSPFHLSGELFNSQAGITMLHVPYRGAAPAVVDLLGGQIQVMFDNIPNVLTHIRNGKLRALAVTSRSRVALLPEVPTMAESGYAGAESQSFFALVAPKDTPTAVIDALSNKLVDTMRDPALKARFAELGVYPMKDTPQQASRYLDAQVTKWAKVVKASGAKPDQ
jgi:tripartite-type tricarboxylate transporter receptor subunit TctC